MTKVQILKSPLIRKQKKDSKNKMIRHWLLRMCTKKNKKKALMNTLTHDQVVEYLTLSKEVRFMECDRFFLSPPFFSFFWSVECYPRQITSWSVIGNSPPPFFLFVFLPFFLFFLKCLVLSKADISMSVIGTSPPLFFLFFFRKRQLHRCSCPILLFLPHFAFSCSFFFFQH